MSYPIYYVEESDTLPILFDTFDGGTGASITMTGLAVTDIEIYKDGGVTQRASDAGYTLLDTDGIDFDGITGIHGFSIDLSDNTDAGFYSVGPWYHVVVSTITVDAQTVSFVAAAFRIVSATRGMAGTALPAAAADAAGGLPISDAGGLDLDGMNTNVSSILTDTGTTLDNHLTDIKGTGFVKDTHSLIDIETYVDLIDDGTSGLAKIATDVAAVLVDTADMQPKLGTPAGASISADIATVDANVDSVLADTGTDGVLIADGAITSGKYAVGAITSAVFASGAINATAIAANAIGASELATDAVEEIRDSVLAVFDEANILVRTTIATLASQTSFTLSAGSTDNDAYNGAIAVITDVSTAAQKAVGIVSDYVGATKTVTLAADPGIFTMAATDKITILASPKSLPAAPPDAAGGLPVSDAGGLDLDAMNTNVTAILDDTDLIDDGTSGLAKIATDVAAVLVDTAEIGAAGAGLTDLGGMSNGMKAEVNAEVDDVLSTDAQSLPAQGAPSATPPLADAIMWLYKMFRNKTTQTSTQLTLYADDGSTVDSKSTVSDDGTTATKGEWATGP